MGSQQGLRQPQLGATFYPGGVDDFYMPEVISPSPQRITPEVPGNIQNSLTHLELDAGPVNRLSGLQSPSPIAEMQGDMLESFPSRPSSVSTHSVANPPKPSLGPTQYPQGQTPGQSNQYTDLVEQPSFSPFPPLRKRSANVPPSDVEKERILETARAQVLKSDDPEMQLSWAQDTLAYVEIASQNEARVSENQAARPQTPGIEHQLRVDAINVVSFLADQHHPKAEFMRGMWLEFGKFGIRMDKKEAFRCYQRASQRGYARAEYRMGMQFESSNEPVKAIKHYTLAQVNLPEQYLPLNIPGARFNIEKAAYLGFAKAQVKMGAAYELCQLGCDFDPALSLHYNALAAKQGEPEADMAISKWFLCGYEGVFEKNEELAFTYAQRAAQLGLATAEFALGYFYEIGIYVPADLKTSRSWYEKAAEHGNKDAIGRIDGISRSKTLSRKDHENVAVAKIKSQYGSHRGKRPDRFKNPSAPMPTIEDNPIDMPEPNLPPSRPGQQAYAYRNRNGTPERPTSSAPYPVEDGRGRPPVNGPLYSNPNLPIHPAARPPSIAQSETSFGDNNFRGSGYPTFQASRPAKAGDNVAAGRGRGTQVLGPENAGAGRGRGGPIYGPPGPQGLRKPNSGYTSPRPPGSPAMNASRPQTAQPQPPAIDIGFSAPPDLSGADPKALKELHESQLIAGKAAGKQIVYHAIQDPTNALSLEDLAAMDAEIATLRTDITNAKATEKLLRTGIVSANATLSIDELHTAVALLEYDKIETLRRLGPLREGSVKPVAPDEKKRVDGEWEFWGRKAGARKKFGMELWEMCTEEVEEGKTREDVWEEWGLEGDE
ncbi:26S proteasome regulatory subunit, ATPase 3, interacting protein, partial [Lecanoromycetidae sp. Uapishka_2]